MYADRLPAVPVSGGLHRSAVLRRGRRELVAMLLLGYTVSDWREELPRWRRRAASRAKGFQSLRQICKARGLDYAKVRPALYNKQAVNDRPWHVEVLKAFCGEG